MSTKVKIGIIGGSGLDNPQLLQNRKEKTVNTPFGQPSDSLICGDIGGIPCVLLARHGRHHSFNPTNVPYRANIWSLKMEGCTHVLATSACGGLQENTQPGDFVVPDQFIDRTNQRIQTFYDGSTEHGRPEGVVHIPMAEPFCPETRRLLCDACEQLGYKTLTSGTVLTIEGPRFSSRAESKLWHSWGAHVINMSTVPEVILAKEAALCYGLLAMVTDYDSWHDEKESVSVEAVVSTFRTNSERAINVLQRVIPMIAAIDWTEKLENNRSLVKGSHYGLH